MGKDIYIAVVSSAHNVCPKGYYIAIVSTIAESKSNHHVELQAGFERLGPIAERFMGPPIPLYEPLESGVNDNIYISKSYDASSHFETTTGEVFLFFFSRPVVPLVLFSSLRLLFLLSFSPFLGLLFCLFTQK